MTGRSRFRGRTFWRIFLLLSVASLVPLVAITTIAIRFSTSTIQRDVLFRTGVMVREKAQSIERLLGTVADRSREIALSSAAWSLLNTRELIPEDSFSMRELAEENRLFASESSLVSQSIFFDTAHDFVIGATKWSKGEMGLPIARWESAPIGIGVQPPVTENGDFPLILRYESFLSGNVGTFVAIVDSRSLFGDRFQFEVEAGIEVVVEDRTGTAFYRTSSRTWPADTSVSAFTLDGERFFHVASEPSAFGLRLRYFQRSELAIQAARILRRTILVALALMVIVAFTVSLLAATILYRPIYSLVIEVGAAIRPSRDADLPGDEYDTVRETLRDLAARERELEQQMSALAPYLRDHAFDRSLLAEPFDVHTFQQMLEAMGVSFTYPVYSVLGIELLDGQFEAGLIRATHASLRRYADEFVYALSHTRPERLMVIVNTRLARDELRDRLQHLLDEVTGGREWTAALSESLDELQSLPRLVQQVDRQLELRFFTRAGKVRAATAEPNARGESMARERAIATLAQGLRERDADAISSAVAAIFHSHVADGERDERSQGAHGVDERLALMAGFGGISAALRDAHLPGVVDDRLERLHDAILGACATAGTLEKAIAAVTAILRNLVSELVSAASSAHEQVALRMKRFIEKNYRRDLPLEEIAATIPLSPGYASQIYRASQGVSPVEYLQQLRMADAERLLSETETKVKVIAQRVGYQNVHSFMRAFKSVHGVTPTEYRRAKPALRD